MYLFRTTLRPASGAPVDLAFTDRLGGVSAAPFDELNLSVSGDDDEAAKAENHRRLLDDFAPAARLADLYQVHGSAVDVVEERHTAERPRADGVVTARSDVVLMVRAADCVPVLLADVEAGVVGAAHAGRQGMALGIVTATLERMRALGAGQVAAWIGPSICGGCYEVPEALRDEVAGVEPASAALTSWGTPSLDVAAGVRAQLERAGVDVVDVGGCTRERSDLYSYRRDGAGAGRQAALIRLRSST